MSSITFDTLKLAQRLEAAGFPPKQAAETAQALAESLGQVSTLATKADVEKATTELKVLIAESKADILKWMFTSLFAQAVVIVALLKLLLRGCAPHPPAARAPLPLPRGARGSFLSLSPSCGRRSGRGLWRARPVSERRRAPSSAVRCALGAFAAARRVRRPVAGRRKSRIAMSGSAKHSRPPHR